MVGSGFTKLRTGIIRRSQNNHTQSHTVGRFSQPTIVGPRNEMKETKMTNKTAENRQTESNVTEEAQVEEEARQLRERLIELDRRLEKIKGHR
jgi:hypothetical protein